MNEFNSNDLDFFATGKRIKKEEQAPVKSPLETSTKWGIQNKVEQKLQEQSRDERQVSAAAPKNTDEQIGNVGSELQKFRKYPTKTYDKFLNKMVTFNEDEFYLIRDLSCEISMARKKSNIQNKGTLPRVTENTVIRAALKAMFSRIGKTSTDLSTLQTEEALENYFNGLLK